VVLTLTIKLVGAVLLNATVAGTEQIAPVGAPLQLTARSHSFLLRQWLGYTSHSAPPKPRQTLASGGHGQPNIGGQGGVRKRHGLRTVPCIIGDGKRAGTLA
jgi:hypothetical protein